MDMQIYIDRHLGKPVAAYSAPTGVGFGFRNAAEAVVNLEGEARVFAFRDVTQWDRASRCERVIGREHCGSTRDEIQRGLGINPTLKAELMQALSAATAEYESTLKSAPVLDGHGNVDPD